MTETGYCNINLQMSHAPFYLTWLLKNVQCHLYFAMIVVPVPNMSVTLLQYPVLIDVIRVPRRAILLAY